MLGDFERENTITYQGVRSEMVREKGAYWMKFTGVDGVTQQLEIVRTVGSRRIQQYLVKTGDTWFRMPIAYDLMQRRWMHLNGSFFFPDGSDYKQHVAEWNVNCVFCHNVKAQPVSIGEAHLADGGRRIGHRVWRVSRPGGRACATRALAAHPVALELERSKSRPSGSSFTRRKSIPIGPP